MKQMKKLQAAALCLVLFLSLPAPGVLAEEAPPAALLYDVPDTVNWGAFGEWIYRLGDGLAVRGDFSYGIPDEGAVLLVFFSAENEDSKRDLYTLAGEEWISDPRLSVYALETTLSPRDRVQAVMDGLPEGTGEIFRTFYGYGCQSILGRYRSLTTGDGPASGPLAVLIGRRCGVTTIRCAAESPLPVPELKTVLDDLFAEEEETRGWSVAWEWSESDDIARAVFTSDTGELRIVDARVEKHTAPAGCVYAGKVSAKATVTFLGRTYRNAKERTIGAHGHTEGPVVRENETSGTCREKGSWEEVVRCAICGEVLSRERIYTDYGDHMPGETERENVIPATNDADGSYDEVVRCSVCGEELARETVTVPHTDVPDQ